MYAFGPTKRFFDLMGRPFGCGPIKRLAILSQPTDSRMGWLKTYPTFVNDPVECTNNLLHGHYNEFNKISGMT